MQWSNTINLQIQANTMENLLLTLDEIKEEISEGYAMAHDKNEYRRYSFNIEQDEKQ